MPVSSEPFTFGLDFLTSRILPIPDSDAQVNSVYFLPQRILITVHVSQVLYCSTRYQAKPLFQLSEPCVWRENEALIGPL